MGPPLLLPLQLYVDVRPYDLERHFGYKFEPESIVSAWIEAGGEH